MWERFGLATAWYPSWLFRTSLWHCALVFFTLLLGASYAQPLTFKPSHPRWRRCHGRR
jgi:hypothetical protein